MTQPQYSNLTPEAYKEQFVDGATEHILVDVREASEYDVVRIPGAVNLPLSSFQMRVDEVSNDQSIVIVCAHGRRSIMAAEFMASLGYENLYNLEEGTVGWVERGFPTE